MKYTKLILAVALIGCLFDMPYGYYTIVRFAMMSIFSYYAYTYYKKNLVPLSFTFVALALLFQPFVKIVLGRAMWNVVDVAVAVLLLVLWYKDVQKE